MIKSKNVQVSGAGISLFNGHDPKLLKEKASENHKKISADAASAIHQLKEKGEFGAANEILDTMQTFISELKSLEAWAIENSLTTKEFEEKVAEWTAAYSEAISAVYNGI